MTAQTRSPVQAEQAKAALRSSFEREDAAAAPTVDLYLGPSPPEPDLSLFPGHSRQLRRYLNLL